MSNTLSVQSQLVSPFRATLRGTIQDVETSGVTQLHSQPKCMFALVDEMGSWLQCCGIGRNATNKILQDGNEVVLYYASGRKGTGNTAVNIWLFKDAMVVCVGKKNIQKRMKIEMK